MLRKSGGRSGAGKGKKGGTAKRPAAGRGRAAPTEEEGTRGRGKGGGGGNLKGTGGGGDSVMSPMSPMSPNTRARAAAASVSPMSPATRTRARTLAGTTPSSAVGSVRGTDDRKRAAIDQMRTDDDVKRPAEDRKLPAHDQKRPAASTLLTGTSYGKVAGKYEVTRPTKRGLDNVLDVEDNDNDDDDDEDDYLDYDEGEDDNVAHGHQLTKAGENFVLDTVIRDEVFTRQKFVNKDVDLKFSNNPNSICRRMAKKLGVEDDDVEDWWESTREHTHKILKMHRNNTIKGLKKLFQGEST
jgi:hypothetical protein